MQTMTRPNEPLSPVQQQGQPQYEITDDDKARVKRIQDAWDAYNGKFAPPLKVMPDQTDDNVISNRCSVVVNLITEFLFGKEIEISTEEDTPDEIQELLDKVWGRKERRIPLLQKLSMNGSISGQAFLRIVPSADNSYRLIVLDPATIYVKTSPQDCETVLIYCIQYSTNEKRNGTPVIVYYREEIARIDPDGDGDDGDPFADVDASWSIQHWSRVGDRGPWTPSGSPIMWDYNFPPIFSCQNLPNPNDFWGIPDLTKDLIGLNNSLNFILSNIQRDAKMFAQPIIYATGTGQQDIDIRPGKIIGLPLSESKIVSVKIDADIANMLAYAKDLRSDVDELTGVPDVATGRLTSSRGNISGVAVELQFMPLVKKTEKKRCLYGELIIDVSMALLELNNMSAEDTELTLAWQYPLPADDLPAVQAGVLKKQLNISDATIQRELGYDPDEELALSQAEDAQKLEDVSQAQQVMAGTPITPGMQPEMPGLDQGDNHENK